MGTADGYMPRRHIDCAKPKQALSLILRECGKGLAWSGCHRDSAGRFWTISPAAEAADGRDTFRSDCRPGAGRGSAVSGRTLRFRRRTRRRGGPLSDEARREVRLARSSRDRGLFCLRRVWFLQPDAGAVLVDELDTMGKTLNHFGLIQTNRCNVGSVRLRRMVMTDQELALEAVSKAQRIIAEYLEPRPHDQSAPTRPTARGSRP